MPVPTKRLTDAARGVLAVVDQFGAGWEGGTMRDTRSEIPAGGAEAVKPPSTGVKFGAGIVVAGIALLLLVAWRG